jgi:hypothetical protein
MGISAMLVCPDNTPPGIPQGSGQLFPELQPRPEQSHLGVPLAEPKRVAGLGVTWG